MDLLNVSGIGPKSINLLHKLNIYTICDLLNYYPFRYEILKLDKLSLKADDEKVIIEGLIEKIPTVIRLKGNMNKMSLRVLSDDMLVNVVIFNRGFMKPHFQIGKEITIIGKWNKLKNTITASDIRFEKINGVKIESIYRTTQGLNKRMLSKYIDNAINGCINELTDYIPFFLSNKYNFMDKEQAIKIIHNPFDIESLKQAQIRLKYEELFVFMLKINCLKLKNQKQNNGLQREIDYNKVTEFIEHLPFKLTTDQLSAVSEIKDDLISPKRMNRLLQGDVGSGKTIVSIIASYINYLSGYQTAFMAPTEILATQHFENIKKLFNDYNINVELLTGSTKKKEKKQIYQKLENGEIDLIIGTHTLIQDDIKYKNLGLVITDEQHRFGVNQRSNLSNKGMMPDILYMSATPIPRTYALTIYGDMDVSNIKTRPQGRKDIITYVKNNNEIIDVLKLMKQELDSNHQIYIIAPLIEESERSDLENVYKLETNFKKAFKNNTIEILHGKMSSEEKDDVMNKFSKNETNILISTTVIEVGVDVKNATMIVIFDANRFGLSTLHQLRGRVGRNDLQSYCVLISDKSKERLEILKNTNDGFEISEQDFKLRGQGDLFGIKQSGDMTFKIANLKEDYKILLQAKNDSLEFLKNEVYTLDNKKIIDEILGNIDNLN